MSRTGELSWMALRAAGSPVRLAVKASQGPRPGVMTQTMSQGRTPRTTKTAIRIPQVRNHLRARVCMPCRTSALMMALSMLVIDSKRASPRTMRMAEVISISGYPVLFRTATAQGKDKGQRAHRQAKRLFLAASKRRAIRRKADMKDHAEQGDCSFPPIPRKRNPPGR